MKVKIPRGTQDILPDQVKTWQFIEEKIRLLMEKYRYEEIRTPIFEHTEVFARGVGDTTDIVQKEMYSFQDRGGRDLTLRPEGTASVVRSFVENKLFGAPNQPLKLFYIGPMFRYERPQSGRYRQFVQFGVEVLGSSDPAIDVEVITLAMNIYKATGLKNVKLVINSLGDRESRMAHRQALVDHFRPNIHEFCTDCQKRLDTNPLRILDCKVDRNHPLMSSAPSILDYLSDFSKSYFEKVCKYLDDLHIPYTIDPTLVRGLDYYNHTTFEIMSSNEGFGAITSLCGGGRYNGLVEQFGGPETPGIGFALSIERLIAALEAEGIQLDSEDHLDVYIVALGDEARDLSVVLLDEMRSAGLSADRDYVGRKLKGQLKAADRQQANYVVIIGEDEIARRKAVVKNMETSNQTEVDLQHLIDYLKETVSN
ncbi:histidine--tRNA ligase [Fervidibacillus halotolerans]|uniref:Histidine--tRNA ligase n=1 Tax=Fervidibacillus halotolerans TaxID=2980027 RepID=A0A9E8LYE3_9BACI|nr:histidine--tRNA ligase [Fervidibacillus halotolerans]WAA11555.1 histidine--tRNA ligase [Fervidibacillus halotolerans]